MDTSDSVPIEKTIAPKPKTPAATHTEPTVFAPIVVSHTPDETVEVPTTTTIIENTATSQGSGVGTGTSTGTGQQQVIASLPPDNGNAIVSTVSLDKLPEFPGGMAKFYTYVGNNFEKPEIEGTETIKVLVYFVIEKDGSMTDIQVKKDPGYGLGREAIRVLKSLRTKWSPGMIGSKAVRTAYNLPITVQMN